MSKLYKWLGSWPIPEFEDLGDAEVQQFYREALSATPKHMKATTETILEKSITKRIEEATLGEYFPENVWVARGWTEEQINKSDSKPHPLYSKVFRIDIESVKSAKITDKVRKRLRELTEKHISKDLVKKAKLSEPSSSPSPSPDDSPQDAPAPAPGASGATGEAPQAD